jgi:hypothetical protein
MISQTNLASREHQRPEAPFRRTEERLRLLTLLDRQAKLKGLDNRMARAQR